MREPDQDDRADGWPAYRKPSASAWVAAAAVAFSLFILGGFIKTHRQLESLKTESRREIQELRKAVSALQIHAGARAAPERRDARAAGRVPSLPPRGPAAAAGAFADAPPRRAPLVTADTGLSSLLAGDGEGRDAAAFPEAGFPAGFAAPRNQVTFVNNERRKIMIDGGRNQGFSEGGKLELRRRGQWIGDLLVVEVYDDISACDILRGNIPPEPGDSVRRPDSPSF